MNTTPSPKFRTITLTDRQPVRIQENQWPIMARSQHHDSEHETQANRRWNLMVRQHVTDGRTIVYGTYSSRYSSELDHSAGELLTPPDGAIIGDDWYVWDEITAAIKRVAEKCGCEQIADDCIADLPAVEL